MTSNVRIRTISNTQQGEASKGVSLNSLATNRAFAQHDHS